MVSRVALIGLALIAGNSAFAWAAPAPLATKTSPVTRIEVFPGSVVLQSRRSTRQLVVTASKGGDSVDLTRIASFISSNPAVATVKGGLIRAGKEGTAVIAVSAAGKTARIPVSVSTATKVDPVSFKFETLPLLTKQGCSAGSCHGSPHGKGGFSLSLFGYDPRVDRVYLTRDGFNRRLNMIEPADSLLLKKPLLELSHGGGRRLKRSEPAYGILKTWIAEGADVSLPEVECVRIEVYPKAERVLHAPNLAQQLSVLAHYSDGATRDVTGIATYDSSHPSVAKADGEGHVTGSARGQAAISVRYLDKLESVHFTVVRDVPGFAWQQQPESGFIDAAVNRKLKQLQYASSQLCTDSEFIRRVSLDLTGLLPTSDRVRQFLADCETESKSKTPPLNHSASPALKTRSALVDELLATEEFARFWALKKADLMRLSPRRLKEGRADRFAEWLVEAIRTNMPYDRFAREILTSAGDTRTVPTANYFLAIPTAEERTEMSAQLFMGSRLECARCHNHPFENWTMRDYYSISAVFARTGEEKGVIRTLTAGEAQLPTTGEKMRPWGLTPTAAEPPDRRTAFADWLTRLGNPFFARVEANRIWAELFGRGIVNPVDDFRSSNPPANGALLDALAAEFERAGFDRKHLIRLICNSRTYQRSSTSNKFNEADDALFSHAKVRLLSAEQLQDAIGRAARALPEVTANRLVYATQRPYPEGNSFTAAFGQPQRETACTCERQTSPTLLQALELLNGGIAQRSATAGAAKYAAMSDDGLVEELYLSALSRKPTAAELTKARAFLSGKSTRQEAVADLVWTVVNTQEFLFQH